MQEQIEVFEDIFHDIRVICTHEFEPTPTAPARRCGSPALLGQAFCYYHHPNRKPRTLRSDRAARRARSIARRSFNVPVPTNPRELQNSLNTVMQRIATNEVDLRRAAMLVRALEISSRNLARPIR